MQLGPHRAWRVTVGTLASSEIDLAFSVARTLQPRASTAELTLYNLTETHRAELRRSVRPFVKLEAGYVGGMSVLFQGDGRRVDVQREKGDWIVKITAGDGEHALRTARVLRSFGANTRLAEVMRSLADAMGVGEGNIVAALAGAQLDRVGDLFPGGTVLHGRAAHTMTRLMTSIGFEWSIQDGNLQVLPLGRALSRTAVRLSASTGMLESPELAKDHTVHVKALIQPDLVPGRLVRLESALATGQYRIEKADYSGDTASNDWEVELTMRVAA